MTPDNVYICEGYEEIDPIVLFTYYLLCVEAKMNHFNLKFNKVQDIKLKLTVYNLIKESENP